MKNAISVLTILVAALVMAGCSTVDSRIKEKQPVFDSLTPTEQANVRQGIIEVGYTPDMVYMAMGKADKVTSRATAKGTVTTWIYNQYYKEYMGRRFVGHRRDMYYDSRAKVWRVYYTPVSEAVYRDRMEEIGRIVFRDGKVESIEQVQ
ncbi:hypothetical protein M2447_000724 [Ereboglobus sp. PH5-10]|uniref:hypothetical protein n=1 Tax=Ereboglobus sp. PH5-10 TaxID=2940629 RepID=UPI00240645A1|nr:hypothetical protein [Ereboglobus sp. PH5-10]MDF9826642.1 hypothetical protein [Ereboglobus sp. PH5-10]